MITGVASFYYALDPEQYSIAMILYSVSYALDALDGVAARKLNQCACRAASPRLMAGCIPLCP